MERRALKELAVQAFRRIRNGLASGQTSVLAGSFPALRQTCDGASLCGQHRGERTLLAKKVRCSVWPSDWTALSGLLPGAPLFCPCAPLQGGNKMQKTLKNVSRARGRACVLYYT